MFKVPKEQEIDSLLLSRFIDKHKAEIRSRYKGLKDAYESDHEILHMPAKPRYKPDNRIVVNFPKYIADTMNGFLLAIRLRSRQTVRRYLSISSIWTNITAKTTAMQNCQRLPASSGKLLKCTIPTKTDSSVLFIYRRWMRL